jgi:hypothetical protein
MSSDIDENLSDVIEERVAEFLKTAQELKGEHSIPARELFPPSFMCEHTSFERVEEFLIDGDFDTERDGGWDALADEGLDQHVRDTTDFESWAEMKDAAKEEWILEQLRS